MTALPRSNQPLAYVEYASPLFFPCAWSSEFRTSLRGRQGREVVRERPGSFDDGVAVT